MVLRRTHNDVCLILLLLTGSLVAGIDARWVREVHKEDDAPEGLSDMLPKGIVPPSGPSPCHNILERKRTHQAPPFVPPFAPPFAPPFFPQIPFPFDPPPPPPDDIICP
ncbi:hypothetical protein HanIR_Chr17g0898071 [Helianthus annuus]|nr:hypothetical protein HanIR_Chr17g0898071 [Helianthus annuus]